MAREYRLYEYLIRDRNINDRYDLSRYYSLFLQLQRIDAAGIRGDVAELGVYRGNTAEFIRAVSQRTLHLFDTFTGFDSRDSPILAGGFGDIDEEDLRARVEGDRTKIYRGYFPETASDLVPTVQFALVHIDMDLFEPILSALMFFYPRTSPGGCIIVHDYNNPGSWDNGARRAVDAFLADKPERGVEMPDRYGSIFIIKHMESN